MGFKKGHKIHLKHGLCGSLDYNLWKRIKRRCYSKSFSRRDDWGGRGISMFQDWIDSPVDFINYVSSLDNYRYDNYTLDRIDNDGDYEPGNLRWTSPHTQSVNKRLNVNNKTGYKGIFKTKCEKYQSMICEKWLGNFNTIEDAVKRRNDYIIENNLKEYKIQ